MVSISVRGKHHWDISSAFCHTSWHLHNSSDSQPCLVYAAYKCSYARQGEPPASVCPSCCLLTAVLHVLDCTGLSETCLGAMPTAALWSISALFSISLVMCVLHPPAMPNPWCSASFWTLFHLLLCQSHFSFCVYILKLLWNISKSDWASGTLTQNESQQSPPSWTSTHTAYSSIECFQRMLREFRQLFPLHSKGEKPKVHTLEKRPLWPRHEEKRMS